MNAVIFDLDGVICSTDKYRYIAWKRLADKYNIYFDEEINNTLRGVSRADSLEIILKHTDEKYSDQKKQEMLVEKNDTYKELLTEVCPKDVLPYVKETLIEFACSYHLWYIPLWICDSLWVKTSIHTKP